MFGDYIDAYDILQAKEDKATVPIYYEARLAKIDPNFEEVTEDAEGVPNNGPEVIRAKPGTEPSA